MRACVCSRKDIYISCKLSPKFHYIVTHFLLFSVLESGNIVSNTAPDKKDVHIYFFSFVSTKTLFWFKTDISSNGREVQNIHRYVYTMLQIDL